jgi:putative membrane protein
VNLADLPVLNACLNGLSATLLTAGYICIKRKNEQAHRNCMVAALLTSTLFLASYLYYHFHVGRTVFPSNWFRPVYLVILLTHTVLAVVIVPLIIAAVVQAVRRRFDSHKKLTRWTWPLWMYVSVTGVVIYLLLYQFFPPVKP